MKLLHKHTNTAQSSSVSSATTSSSKPRRMGFTMGLNFILLLAMAATNLLSFYHLSTTIQSKPTTSSTVPDYLIHQLSTIRSTIQNLQPSSNPSQPSDLLIYAHFSPIASSCQDHSHLLHKYMNYTPFTLCPQDSNLAEHLILRGCHPLPRRRCFSPTTPHIPTSLPQDPFSPLPESKLFSVGLKSELGFDMSVEKTKFLVYETELDLPISHFFQIANAARSVIRLAIDVGGGTGTFAAQMKLRNVTVVTTTMNLGAPYNEAVAFRGLVALHVPLQQRLPVFDGVVDLVRCGRAVNRWIPVITMEFMFFDVDRVLRGGGYFWLDHFFSKKLDLDEVFKPLIGKLGYRIVKWSVVSKSDTSGLKKEEVYLTTLLQKPLIH